MLWQLKRLSTNEPLNEPQELPDNWKNIFGLHASKDRLGDLSWAGHEDMGWFEIGPAPEKTVNKADQVKAQVEIMLRQTADKVSIENASITKGERIVWMEYRQALKDLHLRPGFPDEIFWPARPE
jgi:hypothetical protein